MNEQWQSKIDRVLKTLKTCIEFKCGLCSRRDTNPISFQTCRVVLMKDASIAIETLKTQLAESQARERAAIADLKHNDNCDICKHNVELPECNCECLDCKLDCVCGACRDESNWEWRGKEQEQWSE